MPIFIENGCIMILFRNIILLLFCISYIWASNLIGIEYYDDQTENGHVDKLLNNNNLIQNKNIVGDVEKVRIQVYYQCLCPYCISFFVKVFAPIVDTMYKYLHIQTYPFGNGKIIDDNDTIKIECQLGELECYGNKLHGCAIVSLQHITALRFNACLMNSTNGTGSDDEAADRCGKSMNVDSKAIKACAKSDKGMEILWYFGKKSEKANFTYVPYIVMNNREYKGADFEKDVCAAFVNPPPPCKKFK